MSSIDNFLNDLPLEKNNNLENIRNCIINLRSADWLGESCNVILKNLEEDMSKYTKRLRNNIQNITISLNNIPILETLIKLLLKINALECLEDLVPSLKEDREKINNWFYEEMEHRLKNLKEIYSKNKLDNLKSELNYLENIKIEYDETNEKHLPSKIFLLNHGFDSDVTLSKQIYDLIQDKDRVQKQSEFDIVQLDCEIERLKDIEKKYEESVNKFSLFKSSNHIKILNDYGFVNIKIFQDTLHTAKLDKSSIIEKTEKK